MEYTLITAAFIVFTIVCDIFFYKTKLLLRPRYYLFYLVIIVLHTIVDNYLNGRWGFDSFIVGPYNSFSNIVIIYTPLENYFFGFALITLNCMLYEVFINKPSFQISK